MLNDEPTLLDLREEPTLPDPRRRKPVAAPVWPGTAAAPRDPQPSRHGRSQRGCGVATALVAGAALLLSLLGMIDRAGLASLGRFVGQPSSHVLSSAQAASPTPTSSWLQVAPSSVQFGCADGQRTQVVVLENRGPAQVHWQASYSLPTDQVGVGVSPNAGDLGPGASTVIQLQDTSHFSGQSVVIRFNPSDPQAGSPPSLSFTLVGCN